MDNTPNLYQELAARHGWPESKYLPLILQKMVTPEQAQIMLQFPSLADKIALNLGIDKTILNENLQELFEKGLAFSTRKGWRLGRVVDSLHDLTLSNKKYFNSYGGPEIADLWNAFERLEWWPVFVKNFIGMNTNLFRVVPAREAVEKNPDFISVEDIKEIYKQAETIAAIPCPCRQESYDSPERFPDEVCIALNRSAKYNLKRGVGKELSLEEALEIEKEAREYNLITHVPNNAEIAMVVCHCHPATCLLFKAFEQFAVIHQASAKSRYEAWVADHKNCSGCQKCIETCHFEAIEMKKYAAIKKWKAYVISEKCMGCGNCVVKCPHEGVITMKAVRPHEHIPQGDLDIYTHAASKK